jgi:hypothetical protein
MSASERVATIDWLIANNDLERVLKAVLVD